MRVTRLLPTGRVAIQNLYGDDADHSVGSRRSVGARQPSIRADAGRLNDAQIVVDTSSGMVSIRTQYTGGDTEHPASVEYHIMVPRGANLEERETGQRRAVADQRSDRSGEGIFA